jgi:hypothetical protein
VVEFGFLICGQNRIDFLGYHLCVESIKYNIVLTEQYQNACGPIHPLKSELLFRIFLVSRRYIWYSSDYEELRASTVGS